MSNVKGIFLFLFLFLFFVVGGAPRAQAAEEYKVYSSEAIGAGEKVYHIESCKKTRAYGLLYCSNDDELMRSIGAYQQCKPEGKLLNIPIRGCETNRFVDAAKMYRLYDPRNFHKKEAQGGCSDKPEKQGYYYAPMWGIVLEDELNQPGGPTVRGDAFAYLPGTAIPQALIKKISDHPRAIPIPIYKSTFCGKWDIVDATSAVQTQTEVEQDVDCSDAKRAENPTACFVKDQTARFSKEFAAANCNTDNSKQAVGEFARSGPTDSGDTYTCTIYERITGASGSDLLGQYISALYRWAARIVGIVAVLIMTYSGIQISMAGGDTAKIDSAKHRIMQSIIGLAILFLSGLILYTINPGFFTG